MPAPHSHYFERDPSTASRPRVVALRLPEVELELDTDAGVFSAGGLDAGTRVLLERGPRPDPGARRLVDLGCGYGAIACALAAWAPEATVWAVDTNRRAVELCRANAARAGLGNVEVGLVDDEHPFGPVPDGLAIDGLWSNPPIRIGKDPLHRLLERWLGRLAPEGEAVLVVQRHLGADSLQRWLTAHGHPTERLRSSAGYRVLRARPAAATA